MTVAACPLSIKELPVHGCTSFFRQHSTRQGCQRILLGNTLRKSTTLRSKKTIVQRIRCRFQKKQKITASKKTRSWNNTTYKLVSLNPKQPQAISAPRRILMPTAAANVKKRPALLSTALLCHKPSNKK